MVRIILAAVAGFIAWSILWVGSDQVLMSVMPDWYGAHQLGFERAMTNKEAFTPDTMILMMHIIRAVVITLLSGFLVALMTRVLTGWVQIVVAAIEVIIFGAVTVALKAVDGPRFGLAVFLILVVGLGFVSQYLTKEDSRAPLTLGILLLLFGIIVQIMAWNYLPVWYHLLFLALLIPTTLLGGRLKTSAAPV